MSVRFLAETEKLKPPPLCPSPIEASTNPFDVAINGDGFFLFGDQLVTGGGNVSYLRAGDFKSVISADDPLTAYLASANGRYLLAWPADDQSNFAFGDAATLVPVVANSQADFPGRATSNAALAAVIPATGETTVTSISYYTPVGTNGDIEAKTAHLTFTQTDTLTWELNVTDDDNALLAGPFEVTFDGVGSLTSDSELDIGGLFNLDISNLTQCGTTFQRTQYTQNGIAQGDFQSLDIDADGTIYGTYSSGAIVPLYRIPVALFASPDNLESESGNFYLESDASGSPSLYKPGDSLVRLQTAALEGSNVDLADAFTRMIVTQRAYNSAAQIVRTVDEMTVTLRDLKR